MLSGKQNLSFSKLCAEYMQLPIQLISVQRLIYFYLLFILKHVSLALALFGGSCPRFTEPINLFFNQTFIKNGSYNTINKFKIYFITVFLIFNKINDIQTHLVFFNKPKFLIYITGVN